LAVHCDGALLADIENAHFPSLGEILCPKLGSRLENERLPHGYGRTYDHAVNVKVHQLDLVGREQIGNQKFFSDLGGVHSGEALRIA
jgi:hypothetical protein